VVLETVLVSGNQSRGGVDSEGNSSSNGLGGGLYHASKSDDEVFGTISVIP
jgi:hypothetical protein